jgi:chromosome condensin MukBEF MukE localization factor
MKYPYFSSEKVANSTIFTTFALNYDELATIDIQQAARTGTPSS